MKSFINTHKNNFLTLLNLLLFFLFNFIPKEYIENWFINSLFIISLTSLIVILLIWSDLKLNTFFNTFIILVNTVITIYLFVCFVGYFLFYSGILQYNR